MLTLECYNVFYAIYIQLSYFLSSWQKVDKLNQDSKISPLCQNNDGGNIVPTHNQNQLLKKNTSYSIM